MKREIIYRMSKDLGCPMFDMERDNLCHIDYALRGYYAWVLDETVASKHFCLEIQEKINVIQSDLDLVDIDEFILQISCNEIEFIIDSLTFTSKSPESKKLCEHLLEKYKEFCRDYNGEYGTGY